MELQQLRKYLANLIRLWERDNCIRLVEEEKILICWELNNEKKIINFLEQFKILWEDKQEPKTAIEMMGLVCQVSNQTT